MSSLKKIISERIASPMYSTYILYWLITNWKILYITFFVSENYIVYKYGLLKTEYIASLYPIDSFYTILQLLVIPIAATYLIHWQLSKIEFRFFEKDLDNYYLRKRRKIQEEKKLEESRNSVELEKKKVLTNKKKNIEIEKEIKPKEELWEEEFEKIIGHRNFTSFGSLIKIIYEDDWFMYPRDGTNRLKLPTYDLAFYESNWIIEKIDGPSSKYKFTEKWRFFVKNYSDAQF